MKFNKKLVVTSLSTVLGLGIIGSITGTVAWYQYSTKATASIIGMSSAEAGVLQIKKHSASSFTKTDLFTADLLNGSGENTAAKLYPVTFGGFAKNAALPSAAYRNPEAGVKEIDLASNVASVAKDYIQFTVDLRALKADGTQAALPVYLSDIVLEDAETAAGTSVTPALRMHIACGSTYYLIGGAGATAQLDCHGNLDLNGDGSDDTNYDSKYEWERTGTPTPLDYGFYNGGTEVATTKQTVYTISEVVNARSTTDGSLPEDSDKLIGTTSATAGTNLEVTVTIWLEGWQALGGEVEWPANSVGRAIHVGLTFDVGARAFDL